MGKGNDDVRLKNRHMVLNFGEQQDEEEEEGMKMSSQLSGNSTPHGASAKEGICSA